MEKEHSESMTTIPIKAEYAPSEVYSTEPPPAYHRPKSSAVQIAKIVSMTVVLVSIILGGFILASAYISATASCKQLEQELQLLTETADRLQPLQPEALVQDEPQAKESTQIKRAEEPIKKVKEIDDNSVHPLENNESVDSNESEDEEEKVTPIHVKLPLHLDLDDIAGSIIDRNQRSKMNCVVEKKRAEEVVDHKPKSIQLPFGLNLTTDPRFEHVTGERMVIICESGSMQRHTPPQQQQPEDQEETVMIQPVVIPYGPPTHFQTHMPQQMRPIHPMETMRPPMPGPVMPQIQQQQQQQPEIQVERVQALPNPFIHQIAQQLINQRIRMEMMRAQEEAQRSAASEQRDESQNSNEQPHVEVRHMPEIVMAQKLPIPEEVLRQINRLPNHEVIVSVSEESEEAPPQQEVRFVQQPRESSEDVNARQGFARGIPVHIPVPMMHHSEEHQDSQQMSAPSTSSSNEEMRPHYVQPRSVRSVDALLPKSDKRVKRCACDCAC